MPDTYNRAEEIFRFIVVLVVCFAFVWVVYVVHSNGYKEGYKQGQIDSFNGKIKYQLEKNEDGEMVYVEIQKIEKEKNNGR